MNFREFNGEKLYKKFSDKNQNSRSFAMEKELHRVFLKKWNNKRVEIFPIKICSIFFLGVLWGLYSRGRKDYKTRRDILGANQPWHVCWGSQFGTHQHPDMSGPTNTLDKAL